MKKIKSLIWRKENSSFKNRCYFNGHNQFQTMKFIMLQISMDSFTKYLLSTYHVPSPMLDKDI